MDSISISRLAKTAGISAAALRYYEQLGLIQSRSRAEGAVRQFPQETLQKLKAIAALQDLGFTLKEILRLTRVSGGPRRGCILLNKSLASKLSEVDAELRLKKALRSKLQGALRECRISKNGCEGKLAKLLGFAS
jgi:MerR family mercuric resistance operon transcriptional regulator